MSLDSISHDSHSFLPSPNLVTGLSPVNRETVDCSAVSLFKSRCFKLLGTAAILAASVTWILPAALSHMEVPLDPQLIKTLLGTILVGVALIGLKLKKEIVYEISTLYTIYGSHPWKAAPNSWWSIINDYIVLGALPLKHQIATLKQLGITHVIAMIEPFEFEPGIVQPVQSQQWRNNGIEFKHIKTPDFLGVPEQKIHVALNYIETQRKITPNAKFYIHCKAGRGRSAAVVLCHLMKTDKTYNSNKEDAYARLKKLRHINLNKNQMVAVQNYLDSDFFKT